MKAEEQNLFLMEGMWTRFFPAMTRLRELVKAGAIGDVRMLQADFGFRTDFNPDGRLFKPELAGGALLDVEVYCVSLASMLFGSPTQLTGVATLGKTGVDEQSAMTLGYENGAIALLSSAIRTNSPHEATLWGTGGRITIPSPWWKPSRLVVTCSGKLPEEIAPALRGQWLQLRGGGSGALPACRQNRKRHPAPERKPPDHAHHGRTAPPVGHSLPYGIIFVGHTPRTSIAPAAVVQPGRLGFLSVRILCRSRSCISPDLLSVPSLYQSGLGTYAARQRFR